MERYFLGKVVDFENVHTEFAPIGGMKSADIVRHVEGGFTPGSEFVLALESRVKFQRWWPAGRRFLRISLSKIFAF
jgi:hypothetical protein